MPYPDQTLIHRNAVYVRQHLPNVQTLGQFVGQLEGVIAAGFRQHQNKFALRCTAYYIGPTQLIFE